MPPIQDSYSREARCCAVQSYTYVYVGDEYQGISNVCGPFFHPQHQLILVEVGVYVSIHRFGLPPWKKEK